MDRKGFIAALDNKVCSYISRKKEVSGVKTRARQEFG